MEVKVLPSPLAFCRVKTDQISFDDDDLLLLRESSSIRKDSHGG